MSTATLWTPGRTRPLEPSVADRAKLWDTKAHVRVYAEDKLRDAHLKAQRLGFFLDPTGECHSLAPVRPGTAHRMDKLIPTPENLAKLGITQDEDIIRYGNLATTQGLVQLFNRLIGSGVGQAYDSTHTGILVGDTATAATVADTDLNAAVAAGNRYGQLVSGTPTITNGPPTLITLSASFATGNGNFVWNEWGIDQRTASGATAATAAFLNHKVTNVGTKTSAVAWTFSVTFTIT